MKKRCVPILACLAAMSFLTNAFAESYEQEKAYKLEGMTVTAQKKEENIQDVPVSMDAFSDIDIEDAGIQTTFDLMQMSPNVHMKSNYTEHFIVIRGISPFRASSYSPAGYYVDDISYPLHYFHNLELFDIERAEVLKGPQGTLYGRNTESGVVNIITKQPDNQFRSKVLAEYGNFNSFRSGASVSGPVVDDTLYLGTAIQYKYSDGFIENESDGSDQVADLEHKNGRATLRWTPGDQWDISLIADAVKSDDHIGGYRLIGGTHETDAYEVRKNADETYDEDGNSQILRTRFHGESYDLLSVTSRLYKKLDKLADSDLWDDPLNEKMNTLRIKQELYSQEFRISSTRKGPFEWLAGLYGFNEASYYNYQYDFVTNNMTVKNPVTDVDSIGYAVFGQGTYTLLGKLHLTAGLRFDHQDLKGDLEDEILNVALDKDLSYDEILPKFSAAYDVQKNVMVYASVSKGYLVGGYNWLMGPTEETFHYDPEYTWSYEAGLKSTWLNDKLMANLAIFYVDIEDKQVTEYDTDTSTTTITNAAEAHSQGIELQIKAKPVRGLDVFSGVGYTQAEFDNFSATEWNDTGTALIEQDYDGNDLPYAPRYTYNVGVQYRSANGLFGRADLLGTGKFYGDAGNQSSQDAYETVNLRVGFEKERFDVSFWVDNVFDEEYLTYVYPYGTDSDVVLDGEPRTFGVTATFRF